MIATALLGACVGDSGDDPFASAGGDGIDVSGFDDEGEDAGLDDGGAASAGAEGGAADDGISADPEECISETFDLQANAPQVMLVLDKSSSMSDERWVHGGEEVTRWSSLHSVVSDLLTTYDATIDFGATLFPAADAGHWDQGFEAACRVDSGPDVRTDANNAANILASMPSADTTVQGATPARAGMVTALNHLSEQADGSPRAVLLVTDGLANCADENGMFLYDESLPSVVESAYETMGVPTYVVGIDIRDEYVDYAQANAHEVLEDVALAGGVARDGELPYYAADDETALYTALDEVAARIECTLPLEVAVPDNASFEVRVDDELIEQITDCSTESGWHFTDDTQRSTIELCNAACDGLRVTGHLETSLCAEDGEVLPVP
ncbi:MAG: vWA domain-containing protein [Myxococcota bacterium]